MVIFNEDIFIKIQKVIDFNILKIVFLFLIY